MSIVNKLIDLGLVTADAPDISFEELGQSGILTHRLTEEEAEQAWNEMFGEAVSGPEDESEPVAAPEGTDESMVEAEADTRETGRPTKPKRGRKDTERSEDAGSEDAENGLRQDL